MQMDWRIVPLYYLSSISGLIMVGGGIWLIYKEKIYIDKESNQITEVETPIGKFKTNIPALVLFVLGFIPLIYPISQSKNYEQEIRISGNIESANDPVTVYAIVEVDALHKGGQFTLGIPFTSNMTRPYRVLYITQNALEEQSINLEEIKNGQVRLPAKKISPPEGESYVPNQIPAAPEEFTTKGDTR